MVKYLPAGIIHQVFLLVLVLASVAAISREPIPTCSSPKVELLDFPISMSETQTYNFNDFFTGYNLNFSVLQPPSFVTPTPKLESKTWTRSQPGLKSYHLAHDGNMWGNNIVTLLEFNGETRIRWGMTKTNETIPDLTNEALIAFNASVRCFDAIWLLKEGLAMVDCIHNTTIGMENIFVYVNTTSKLVLADPVRNDMYVPFVNITRRKIMLHQEDGENYLIRAYFADSVGTEFAHNTYVEILSLSKPMRPWTIRVLDRSFLHQDMLSVMDFKVYLGDIYILDYHSGVIRFDLTPSQTIIITGRYRTDSGFTRLGVYSNNLANEFLLVLAHDHAIFEIDWTNQIKPELVTKYSIMDGSRLRSLWVSDLYVVAQIEADVLDSKNVTIPYHSTFIFSRGARTYLNAYAVIPHMSQYVFADLNRDNNQLLTMDDSAMTIFKINKPSVMVFPVDPNLLNKQFNFVLRAESVNEYTGENAICSVSLRFRVVSPDSIDTWPTGLKLPDTYYANFPGELFIPLNRYISGPNITYGVKESATTEPPVYYILQQNSTKLIWDKVPSPGNTTFLRQEQYSSLGKTELFIYTQNQHNVTHLTRCNTTAFSGTVNCSESGYAPYLNDHIVNLTATRFHYYQGKFVHLTAIVYDSLPNQIFLYNVENNASQDLKPLMFPQGFSGQIHAIEFLGQYLAVVFKYMKTILFYDMVQCYDNQQRECHEIYRVDSRVMNDLGVKFFSPMDIMASDFHPNVLFVQCLDQVVILDVTPRHALVLATVSSPGTKEAGAFKWKMAIARGHLIIVNPPNIIEEHSLDDIDQGDASFTKRFPIYQYQIPDNFDLDFSDEGDLVYITAIDPNLNPNANAVILVYRAGMFAVSAFYDVFMLHTSFKEILIDATGIFEDYVAVAAGQLFMIFRQYQLPVLVFENTWEDYAFNVTYTNDPQNTMRYLAKSSVKIANYPEDIVLNDTRLKDPDFLTVTADDKNSKKLFDDDNWFNGSVINYTLRGCEDCGKKIKVVNHVEHTRSLVGGLDMEDYVFTAEGGVIQQLQSLIKMRHNGSIEQFVSLPSVYDGESCHNIESNWLYEYTVSACKQGDEVYLYTTVYTASKPFVNGPYYSSAKKVAGMSIVEDLLIVVDVDDNPWLRSREGGVIIYSMNHDPFEPEIFDELQFIDANDLESAVGWTAGAPLYIGNAHLTFTNDSNVYRLVMTEIDGGLFVLDFRWFKGRKSIEVLKVQFINLREELIKVHLPLPNAAFFTAVTIVKQFFDKIYNFWKLEVVVVTSNFHSFQVNIDFDKTGTIVSHEIAKVFYRYGFYQSENYIRSFDGYFVLAQKVPTLFEQFDWYSKMVLTVYDTRERWTFNQDNQPMDELLPSNTHANGIAPEKEGKEGEVKAGNVPVQFMLGGYVFRPGRLMYDFNFTFTRNASDPFRDIGLLVVHNDDALIREFNINDQLRVTTEAGLTFSQTAKLRAQNDFHYMDFNMQINYIGENGGLPGWAIALIVIAILLVAAAVFYLIFIKFIKKKQIDQTDGERSLLEPDRTLRDSNSEDDDDEDEDDEEEEEEEEENTATQLKTDEVKNESVAQVEPVEAAGEALPPAPEAPPVAEVAAQ